jgi:transposase
MRHPDLGLEIVGAKLGFGFGDQCRSTKGGLMGKVHKRAYTEDFKEQAVELAQRLGFGKAANQLGVNVANLRRWEKASKNSEAKEARKTKASLEDENRRLQRENEELKKVNHILKRAAAFFSQDHLK